MKGFIKLNRSEELESMLEYCPNCFLVLTQIAIRAKRTNKISFNGLDIGESMIGDYKKLGLTRQQYRTAIDKLKSNHLITTRTTNRGTIAMISGSIIYDINEDSQQPPKQPSSNHQATIKQPSSNHQATTNKNVRSKEVKNERMKEASLSSSDDGPEIHILEVEEIEPDKKPDPKKKEKKPAQKKKETAFTLCVEVWWEWHEQRLGFKPTWGKGTGREPKGLKGLVEKLTAIRNAQTDKTGNISAEPDKEIQAYFVKFLNSYKTWEPFYQKPSLEWMNNQFTKIYDQIKNGRSSKKSGESDRDIVQYYYDEAFGKPGNSGT